MPDVRINPPVVVKRPDHDPLAILRPSGSVLRLLERIVADQRSQQRV